MEKNNISAHTIFGEYEGTENRVTAAINLGGEPLLRYILSVAGELLRY